MATVVMENVSKQFGTSAAVRDFSVTVADGEFITFLGPSGCGKTTCLRMVAGFTEPTTGCIRIGDRVVSDARGAFVPPEERGVGMVFQSYAVWPHMTVFANVAYPLKVKSTPAAEVQRRVQAMLDLMQMADLGERYPHQLSGGQQQRVALARALVMNPQVLLLDEPLSNLDAKLREEMRFELKHLQQQMGITIIFVTHDQMEAMVLADRIVVMNGGAIQQVGSAADVYLHPANRFVAAFIGVANFLPCRRVGAGAALEASPETVLPIDMPPGSTAERMVLMVRPHDVSLDSRAGQLRGEITQRLFVGDATEYTVGVAGQSIRVRVAAQADYSVGATVYLTLSRVHWFAA